MGLDDSIRPAQAQDVDPLSVADAEELGLAAPEDSAVDPMRAHLCDESDSATIVAQSAR